LSGPGTRAAASVCIIACNEEHNLVRCLESVAFCEEVIVVVDDRSRDATAQIARDAGARVVVHRYEGNVEQKRVAISHARFDWVLSLDADEALSDALGAEIRETLAADGGGFDGFEMNRLTWHLGRWIRHGDFFPDWQLRLFRRSKGRLEGVNPHGRIVVDGRTRRLGGELLHYSYRDLADQVERIQEFSRVQASALFAAGRSVRVRDLWLRPPARFVRAFVLKQGFRDGIAGLVIATATAFHVFLKYAKLWELETSRPRIEPEAGKSRASAGERAP
jgi:glycosyltransferase involved in cell wall biosynthesis